MQEVARKYALLGWPVAHSVSPPMQEAAFKAVGIPATYVLRAVRPEQLAETVTALRDEGFAGWNITVPHKQQMATLLDEIDPEAQVAGSINTVVNRDGRLIGHSTDGPGMEAAVREGFGVELAGQAVVFLGAGGAARAVSAHFALHGVRRLWVFNRTVDRARALVGTLHEAAPDIPVAAHSLADTGVLAAALAEADLLIQATSLGLHAGDPTPIPPELLRPGLAVVDMIYRPTQLLRAAARLGCPTADGRGMLLHQGAESFRIWTGRPAPIEVMRRALDDALEKRRTETV